MDPSEFQSWFEHVRSVLETAYLAATEPWRQSGFSGPLERWAACRRPIADCVDFSGAFLDIGCANGFLLECLVEWVSARDLQAEPFGLDLSGRLIELARERLPRHQSNLFVGNSMTWVPPRRFDYIRTELCYVPPELEWSYVRRLRDELLLPGGRLLVTEYRSQRDFATTPWVDERLREAGFTVHSTHSGIWEGKELTRVAVVPG
jgi:SAM-dependent methyltransferase